MPSSPARPLAARSVVARLLATAVIAALIVPAVPILRAALQTGVDIKSGSVAVSIDHERLVHLPIAASHVTFHWTGAPDAQLTVALGRTADSLSEEIPVSADADAPPGEETYSDVIWADGAHWARISSDRAIEHLTVVAMDTDEARSVATDDAVADAAVGQPAVITRAEWGAKESYRLNSGGYARYAPEFSPLQKLIVHHTAGRNNDPNPAATIRAIYYDHAVIRGWGDIDYNFLIDAQGRVYEGRYARAYAPGETPTGEDLAGNVVRGSHARDFNDGTMGVVLLGNFTSVMPTAAARASLVDLLAWKAERHGINPLGASTYKNPYTGATKWLNNISGHRNVNATACPGELFYATFPTLRKDVANRIAATTGPSVDHDPPEVLSATPLVPDPTGSHTIPIGLIFSEPVTGLTPGALTVGGSSPGWSVGSITGGASTYTVNLVADEGSGGPIDGDVSLTLPAGAVMDLAGHAGPAADVVVTTDFAVDTTPPTVILYAVPTAVEPQGTSYSVSLLFDEPVEKLASTDVTIGGSSNDAEPWTVGRVYGGGDTFNFTVYDPTPVDGTFTFQLAAGATADLAGNPMVASILVEKLIDHSGPVITGPTVTLRTGVSLAGGSLPVRIAWTGADVGRAGIASFDVSRSLDGAAWVTTSSAITGTSLSSTISPGHTYRFRVRARDKVGNLGLWSNGPTLKPALVQQSSTAVHWSGWSTTTTSSLYSGGSERYLRVAGASASYTTTARSLSFITTAGPNRGTAKVYIDGVLAATIDLNTATTTYRLVAFSKTWSSLGTHTIKVVSLGTPVIRVDIDAFGVIR